MVDIEKMALVARLAESAKASPIVFIDEIARDLRIHRVTARARCAEWLRTGEVPVRKGKRIWWISRPAWEAYLHGKD